MLSPSNLASPIADSNDKISGFGICRAGLTSRSNNEVPLYIPEYREPAGVAKNRSSKSVSETVESPSAKALRKADIAPS